MQWKIGRKSERVIGCPRKSILIRNFRWFVSGDLTQDESRTEQERRKHQAHVSEKKNGNDDSRNLIQNGGPGSQQWNGNDYEGYYSQEPPPFYPPGEESDNYEVGPANGDSNGMYVNEMWVPMSDLDQYMTNVDGGDFLEPMVYSQIPVLFHPLPSVSHSMMYPRFRTMHAPDVPLYPNYFIPTDPHYFYYLTRPCAQNEDEVGHASQDPYWNVPPETPSTAQPGETNDEDEQPVHYAESNQDTGENHQTEVAEDDKEEPVLTYPYPGYGFGEPVYSVPVYPLLNPPVRHFPRIPWSITHAQKRRRRRRKEDYADYAYIPPKKTDDANLTESSSSGAQEKVASNVNCPGDHCIQKGENEIQINSSSANLSISATAESPGDSSLKTQEANIETSMKNHRYVTTLQYISDFIDEIILLAQKEAASRRESVEVGTPENFAKKTENTSELLDDSSTREAIVTKQVKTQGKMEPCSRDPTNPADEPQETARLPKAVNGSESIEYGNNSSNPKHVVSHKDSIIGIGQYMMDKVQCEIPDIHRKSMQNTTTECPIVPVSESPKEVNIQNFTRNKSGNEMRRISPDSFAQICSETGKSNRIMSQSTDEMTAATNSQNVQNNLNDTLWSGGSSDERSCIIDDENSNETKGQNYSDPEVLTSSSQFAHINMPKNTAVENNLTPNKHKSSDDTILHSPRNENHGIHDTIRNDERADEKTQEQGKSSMKEVNDEKEISLPDAHHASPYSYLSYITNSEALIRETELELSKLQQLTARSPLTTSHSIYTLAYDSNVTDQSETDEPATPIPSPMPKRLNDFDTSEPSSSDEMQQDIPRAEIIVHEADSASDAGSEDVELLPHRYESRNDDLMDKHGYVNKLSLAMELLKTHENLPYDDEFKRVVAEDNEDAQNGKAMVVCSKGNSPKEAKVLVGNINLGFIGDPSVFNEVPTGRTSDVCQERNATSSSKTSPTAVSTNVEHSHRNSRVSTADSGVQSEDSGDEIGEEAKEVYGALGFTEFEERELWNPADSTTAGYRRFGAQARQRMTIFAPRAGVANPCFCCVIM